MVVHLCLADGLRVNPNTILITWNFWRLFMLSSFFVSNSRSIHVRLALDNSAAVAYINNMGGVRSPL